MAELLTGDPNAMVSIMGRKPEYPCGLIRLSPCTFNNFNDWLNTLRARFNILERNYIKLVEASNKPNTKELSTDELSIATRITEIKNFIGSMRQTPNNLHRDDYYQRIVEIQKDLADTNAMLETVQIALEDRNERYITAGFARPSSGYTATKVVLLAGGALVGWWAYKYVKGYSGRRTSHSGGFSSAIGTSKID